MVVGEFTQEADLLIIGAGPGGYSAAFRAAELGIQTVIVDERKDLGGVCLHAGCIPSKSLLHIAEIIRLHEETKPFGVEYGKPSIDLDTIRDWVATTVSKLASGLASRAKKLGVEFVSGHAEFEDAKNLAVHGDSNRRFKFRRVIVATGSRPVAHPMLAHDHDRILNPWEALKLDRIPERLLVVGGQSITVELACIYSALGSKTTLINEGDALLECADADLIRPLERRLKSRFETIVQKTAITNVRTDGDAIHVEFSGDKAPDSGTFDMVIVATGQEPNLDALNIERTQAALDDAGFIVVDDRMKTNNPRVLAVGDVTGPPWLADRAIAQAKIAAETVAGWNSAFDARAVPYVAFTDPQVAWCGITEREAKKRGMEHAIAKLPWGASGRAVGMGQQDGMTKIIYDPDTKLVLGIGIVGSCASEMIGEGALAVEMGCELEDIAHTIHPHPSIIELISDVATVD